MTEDQLIDVGMYRLKYPLANFEVVLDTRLSTITFRPTEDGNNQGADNNAQGRQVIINLRLNSFATFEEDLRQLSAKRLGNGQVSSKALLSYLDHMTHNRELPPHPVWREAFGDFGLLLLRYAHKRPGLLFEEARDLALWLGALQARSAWRLSFNMRLSFEHRYKLLTSAAYPKTAGNGTAGNTTDQIDIPEAKERQLLWWSAIRRFELAQEWCENEVYNPAARQALRDETINYLRVLKDEPRQQELGRFLSECGTDIETEVKKVLFNPSLPRRRERVLAGSKRELRQRLRRVRGRILRRVFLRRRAQLNSADEFAKDEVIRRAFVVWFLKRYDVLSALRLVLRGPERRWLRFTLVSCGLLNFLAVVSYLIQTNEPAFARFLPAPGTRMMWLWGAQVALQLLSLFWLLFLAPTLFRLLMPRALFGSLLAWCTVIFLALKDIHEFKIGPDDTGRPLTKLCHGSNLSDPQMFGYSLLIGGGIILLGAVFVGYTVTEFTQGFWKMLRRTIAMLCFLLLGSVFWGIALALPIKATLERDTFAFDCHCVIPIVVIGSSIAVLFGLMVELIWQDESLAEPLGEPL